MNQQTNEIARKKVLVTGAGGFIGQALCRELLNRGAKVRAFYRYTSLGPAHLPRMFRDDAPLQVEAFPGDLCDPDSLREAVRDVDVVFHLGALVSIPYSFQRPRQFVASNIDGTLNVLESIRAEGSRQRLVLASTCEVYGGSSDAIDESHPLQPRSPYAASKIAAEKLVESYVHSFGIKAVVVRPFNTYGPSQSLRAVIPSLIVQALTRDDVAVGMLDPMRDFTFIADTVDGFIRAGLTDLAAGKAVNLGTGRAERIDTVAHTIFKIVGREPELRLDPDRVRPNSSEVMKLQSNPSRARELLGWEAKVSLEEGLEKTVGWFRQNLDRFLTSEGYVR